MAGFGKILLVEGDEEYAKLIRSMLLEKDPDCVIIHAQDGVDAISILMDGYRPDMIVSDKKMPRMNGHELLSWVKSNKDLGSIPFFFLKSESCGVELIKYRVSPDRYLSDEPKRIREIEMLILRLTRMLPDA